MSLTMCKLILSFDLIWLISKLVEVKKKTSKSTPRTGRGDLYGCEMLRIPHCPDNRLTDGGGVRLVKATNLF
jgi:hypothetical protein